MRVASLDDAVRIVHEHRLYWYGVNPDGSPTLVEWERQRAWMLFQTEADLLAVLGPVTARHYPLGGLRDALWYALNNPDGVEVLVGQMSTRHVVIRLVVDA